MSADSQLEVRGHLWPLLDPGGVGPRARVYCAMEGVSCGERVWMQVANINMTETSSNCPVGLQKVTSPKSLCRKTVTSGCSSASFSAYGVPFSRVCGQVIGYQYAHVNAFRPYFNDQHDLYVDGVHHSQQSSTAYLDIGSCYERSTWKQLTCLSLYQLQVTCCIHWPHSRVHT